MTTDVNTTRRFRPRWWAAALTLVFAAITIHLGNWQATRAEYKIEQQRLLDDALAAPPIALWASLPEGGDSKTNFGTAFRYRAVNVTGEFKENAVFFVDNKIQDGKAGYGVLQLFRADREGKANESKWVLVDSGWIAASGDRTQLPEFKQLSGIVSFIGRINLPVSRNPGTMDNDAKTPRLNYVNIDELAKRLDLALEPYIIEQTLGAGFLNTPSVAPAANYQKNRAYQMQWYAFAVLAVVLFLVLSFRTEKK
jgi:surfeit locus 1 family protein